MPRITVIKRAGDEVTLETSVGLSVMESIRDSGVTEILAACGGCCSCATCHVYVDDQWSDRVGAPGALEAELLEASEHHRPTSRLSCQITMSDELDGLRVAIASED
jgi:2Fe-2S ferredoxin